MSPRGGPRPGSGRPRGRKPRPPALYVEATEDQLDRWRDAAEGEARPLSEWVRRTLDAAAEEVVGAAD